MFLRFFGYAINDHLRRMPPVHDPVARPLASAAARNSENPPRIRRLPFVSDAETIFRQDNTRRTKPFRAVAPFPQRRPLSLRRAPNLRIGRGIAYICVRFEGARA